MTPWFYNGEIVSASNTNLKLWLDATDNSTLGIQNVGGENYVTSWVNKAISGDVFTHVLNDQSSGINAPKLKTNTVYGQQAVYFDKQNLSINTPIDLSTKNTVFMVIRYVHNAADQSFSLHSQVTGSMQSSTPAYISLLKLPGFEMTGEVRETSTRYFYRNMTEQHMSRFATGTGSVATLTFINASDSSNKILYNNRAHNNNESNTMTTEGSGLQVRLIGQLPTETLYYSDHYVAEILAFDKVLSTAEIRSVTKYIDDKYFCRFPNSYDPLWSNVELYIPFVGITDSPLVDVSKNRRTLIPISTEPVNRVQGDGVFFNSNAGYRVDTNGGVPLGIGGEPFSIEMDIWITATKSSMTILNYTNGLNSNANFAYGIDLRDNSLMGWVMCGFQAYPSTGAGTIPLKQWVRIEVSFEGNKLREFINGNMVRETNITNAINNPSNAYFTIGRNNFSNAFDMNGGIRNFRITKGVARHIANYVPDMNYLFPNKGLIDTNNPSTFEEPNQDKVIVSLPLTNAPQDATTTNITDLANDPMVKTLTGGSTSQLRFTNDATIFTKNMLKYSGSRLLTVGEAGQVMTLLGNKIFCIEGYIKHTSGGTIRYVFGASNSTGTPDRPGIFLYIAANNNYVLGYSEVGQAPISDTFVRPSHIVEATSSVYHFAVRRLSNGALTLDIDGVSIGVLDLSTKTLSGEGGKFGIGSNGDNSSNPWRSHIAGFKITVDTTVYNDNTNPYVPNPIVYKELVRNPLVLYLKGDSLTKDNSIYNRDLTTDGTISTSGSPSSINFGNNGSITTRYYPSLDMRDKAFSLETIIKFTSNKTSEMSLLTNITSTVGLVYEFLIAVQDQFISFYYGIRGSNQAQFRLFWPGDTVLSLNVEYAIKISRDDDGLWSCYLNGVRGTKYQAAPPGSTLTWGAVTTGDYVNKIDVGSINKPYTVGNFIYGYPINGTLREFKYYVGSTGS